MEVHKSVTPSLAAFLLFFLCNSIPLAVHGQLLSIIDEPDHNTTKYQIYIVHVQKPKGTKFLNHNAQRNWYMSFLPNTSLDSGEPRMVYAYHHVMSGFAARLTQEEVQHMEAMDGFLLAYPEEVYEIQTTYTPKFLGLELGLQAGGMWYDSLLGQGQTIGVIDTGVKYTHPSFDDQLIPPPPTKWNGSCYWRQPICNKKLLGAVAFKNGRTITPLDTDGHGTHTASTAAGNFVDDANVLGTAKGTASGTAPGAHLAIYKVLHKNHKNQSTGTSGDILKGIEQAIRDHVDVLSMSLGAVSLPFHRSSVAIGSFAAITKGIVPCAAAGNSGPTTSIIANDAPWVLTVGASTTDRRIRATIKLGDGREFFGESAYQPQNFSSRQLPMVYPGIVRTEENLSCQKGSMAAFNVKGKIVLCGTGYISNTEKGEIVKKAGGAAIIVMSQPWEGSRTSADPHVIPASHVAFSDAIEIINYFQNATNPTAAIIFEGTQFGARPTPVVASFSSRGPSRFNGNIIKPDIIAPGVNILAAWPTAVGPNTTSTSSTFNFASGTSMATPHVAGIVALLRNNHPNWSPAAIKSAIMTTAYRLDSDRNPIRDQYELDVHKGIANIFAMGSGHVDPAAADDPGLIYDLHQYDYIHYLCGLKSYSDKEISAIAQGQVQCSKVHAIDAEQLNYPSFSVSLGSNSTTKTVKRTVTNVGDANSVYTVQFDEPKGVRVDVIPDKLNFTGLHEKQSFEVTLSTKGTPPKAGEASEGQLYWVSGKYMVRSPIAVTFI